MSNLTEFDWCHFCKYDNWYTSCVYKCDSCTQKDNEKPTEFEENKSVKAYREALSATAEM